MEVHDLIAVNMIIYISTFSHIIRKKLLLFSAL